MVDAIMFESVYYYKQWSIINNHNVPNCSRKMFESARWSRISFYSFFSFFTDFPFLSLNSSLLSTMIISRRIPLSFVAAAAAVAAALALELQKKIHLVASSQE